LGGVFGALWVFGAFVCSSRREEDLAAGGDCLRVLSEKKQWLDHVIFIVLVVVASFGNDATRPMTKIMSRILVEILREREREPCERNFSSIVLFGRDSLDQMCS
jgi:hypothetical protein